MLPPPSSSRSWTSPISLPLPIKLADSIFLATKFSFVRSHLRPLPSPPSHLMTYHSFQDDPPFASPLDDPPSSPEMGSPPSSPTKRPFSRHRDSLLHRTMTLYDWDDTFFPSTYLAAQGVRIDEHEQLPQSLTIQIAELEAIVIKILQQALAFGVVKVITNAEEGWVELSGARFMPKLTKFLRDHDIKVVSARTNYESEYPDSPSCWKTAAFAAEVDESFPDVDRLNVLVLGDSLSEREAAHNLATRMPMSCVKSVKLVERPNVTQLQRQIALLHGSFRELREHYGSFDVNLTC